MTPTPPPLRVSEDPHKLYPGLAQVCQLLYAPDFTFPLPRKRTWRARLRAYLAFPYRLRALSWVEQFRMLAAFTGTIFLVMVAHWLVPTAGAFGVRFWLAFWQARLEAAVHPPPERPRMTAMARALGMGDRAHTLSESRLLYRLSQAASVFRACLTLEIVLFIALPSTPTSLSIQIHEALASREHEVRVLGFGEGPR